MVEPLFLKYLQADPFAGGVTVAVKLSVQTLLKQLGAVNGQSAVLLQAKEFYISYSTLSGYTLLAQTQTNFLIYSDFRGSDANLYIQKHFLIYR